MSRTRSSCTRKLSPSAPPGRASAAGGRARDLCASLCLRHCLARRWRVRGPRCPPSEKCPWWEALITTLQGRGMVECSSRGGGAGAPAPSVFFFFFFAFCFFLAAGKTDGSGGPPRCLLLLGELGGRPPRPPHLLLLPLPVPWPAGHLAPGASPHLASVVFFFYLPGRQKKRKTELANWVDGPHHHAHFISPPAASSRALALGRSPLECFRRVKTGGEGRAGGQRSGEKPGPRAGTPPEAPLTPYLPPPLPLCWPGRHFQAGRDWQLSGRRASRRSSDGRWSRRTGG